MSLFILQTVQKFDESASDVLTTTQIKMVVHNLEGYGWLGMIVHSPHGYGRLYDT